MPPDCELTPRHEEIPAWDDMPAELKPILARQMEIYAGFLEHTDHHVGRLVDTLEDLGVLDDTLIYYIIGDNGASAEGTVQGSFNEMMMLNGASALETTEFMASKIDLFGTPEAYNHYAVGWAHAMDTPYQWTKQVASHWGGTRNGTIVHWPRGFTARGEVRSQFHHVIDVAPTVLEAAGLPEPTMVDGVSQRPIEGVSMTYTFDGGSEADRRRTQYFEMFCNRGIYHEGWAAVTRHSTPWVMAPELPPLDEDVWELYDTTTDWSQTRNLAGEMPDKLAELQELFLEEARKYGVLPLDDRRVERFNPDLAGRPTLIKGTTQLLFGGMGRLTENVLVNVKNKSHSVTAEVVVPEAGATGVIMAQGGAYGGWALYAHEGKPAYCYNLFGLQRFKTYGEASSRRARTRCAWSSPTTVAAWRRAARSRCSSTGRPWEGTCGGHRADGLLGRRDRGRRTRHGLARVGRLHGEESIFSGDGRLGADRPRRGLRGPRPPDHTGGAVPDRDGSAVGADHASASGRFAADRERPPEC